MDEPPTPPEPELYSLLAGHLLGDWADLPPTAREAWLALAGEPEPEPDA